ncbi:hypothetical protein GXW83_31050 [Streptacidiphilus sp. PB12-B1b]|uniref:hypothetical protein n=1 Tax=Streptacidiphilus sp. PB12-B1b TaxID=2705012 RepID=UPI0015F86993|nr:hypothetical protein [Streptacidiphilus sp. PB12-B1b]QMU79483.1 hypothetical protein GXW83_31050 [Streptacidiphilus sp. PB12-B1b]
MEPISVLLLAALASGAGGEAGKQAWAGLAALVRRPFHRSAGSPPVSSGEAELVALQQAPDDTERAHALSTALAVRAALDPGVHDELQQWHERAKQVSTEGSSVVNSFSGVSLQGTVLQGRDFSGISFNAPATTPPAATPPDPAPPQG